MLASLHHYSTVDCCVLYRADFPDYSAEELMQISSGMLADEQLVLSEDATAALTAVFAAMAQVQQGEGLSIRLSWGWIRRRGRGYGWRMWWRV